VLDVDGKGRMWEGFEELYWDESEGEREDKERTYGF
jgi:hypothetical protein